MDNMSIIYKAQYEGARDHADKGERLKALEICWNLRNDASVGIYRKALVNLLIARIVDIKNHPDKAKYAQEAIALVNEARHNFSPLSIETAAELDNIEAAANRRLTAIKEEQLIWDAMKGKPKEEALKARADVIRDLEKTKEEQGEATTELAQ